MVEILRTTQHRNVESAIAYVYFDVSYLNAYLRIYPGVVR